VSLFVWLPGERAKWVEMRAERDRAIRDMFGQWRRSRKAKLRAVQNHI
jgi:hypothetical protein